MEGLLSQMPLPMGRQLSELRRTHGAESEQAPKFLALTNCSRNRKPQKVSCEGQRPENPSFPVAGK